MGQNEGELLTDEVKALFRRQLAGESKSAPAAPSRIQQLANTCALEDYQSPVTLVRLVTQLQWQSSSDVPPCFLEDLTSENSPAALLAKHGWSVSGAALREDPVGELVLDLLTCVMSAKRAYGEPGMQTRGPGTPPAHGGFISGPSSQEGHNASQIKPIARPSSAAPSAASSSNIILNTCTTPAAVKAYLHLVESADIGSKPASESIFSPSVLMTWLHQASQARARIGMQVLFQEESDLYLMQHSPKVDAAAGPSSPPNSNTAPSWTQTRLDPSIPMPGLLNLATPPCIVGVAPRCVASNGLSSLKISVFGMYIQGGKILARCGGRYLQASWRMHESVRVTSRAHFARWQRIRAMNGGVGSGGSEEAPEQNMEMEAEVVIHDPPACGLVAIECRQGYLVSMPAYLLVVPATRTMARELTSGLACAPPSYEVFSRSSTQRDLSADSNSKEAEGSGTRTPSLDGDSNRGHMLCSRSQVRAKRLEVVKDSISRDLGTWLQFMHLMRRQQGLDSRVDFPPGNALLPICGTPSCSAPGRRSSFSKEMLISSIMQPSRPSLSSWQPSPQGTDRSQGPAQRRNSTLNTRLPNTVNSSPSTDLTVQLCNVALTSYTHKTSMVTLGVRLLRLACEMAWPATARTILTGLVDLGLSIAEVEEQASSQDGLSFLHCAVRSRNAGMVAEVVAWADAARQDLDWGVADSNGITPLHLAACLEDGGLLAIHILRKWPAAGPLWLTKETGNEKLTPKDVAEAVGNDFLNRMADMAGLLACRDCTEMACAVRPAPLPGQLLSGPSINMGNGSTQPHLDEGSRRQQAAGGHTHSGTPGSPSGLQPLAASAHPVQQVQHAELGVWAASRSAKLSPVPESSGSNVQSSGSKHLGVEASDPAPSAFASSTALPRAPSAWEEASEVPSTPWPTEAPGAGPAQGPHRAGAGLCGTSDAGGGIVSAVNTSSPVPTSPRTSPHTVSSSSALSNSQPPQQPPPAQAQPGRMALVQAWQPQQQQQQQQQAPVPAFSAPGVSPQRPAGGKQVDCAADVVARPGTAPAPAEAGSSPPPRKRGLCGLW